MVPGMKQMIAEMEERVKKSEVTSFEAAQRLLDGANKSKQSDIQP